MYLSMAGMVLAAGERKGVVVFTRRVGWNILFLKSSWSNTLMTVAVLSMLWILVAFARSWSEPPSATNNFLKCRPLDSWCYVLYLMLNIVTGSQIIPEVHSNLSWLRQGPDKDLGNSLLGLLDCITGGNILGCVLLRVRHWWIVVQKIFI